MPQIERIRRGTGGKGAEIALDDREGVVSEEGRDGGLALPFTLQRGDSGTQLVGLDRQDLVAGHRATLSAADFEIAD